MDKADIEENATYVDSKGVRYRVVSKEGQKLTLKIIDGVFPDFVISLGRFAASVERRE